MAVSVPQLSCPGLISRSQSALSEEAPSASFAVETLRAVEAVETVEAVEAVEALERPTLLTASKVGQWCQAVWEPYDIIRPM